MDYKLILEQQIIELQRIQEQYIKEDKRDDVRLVSLTIANIIREIKSFL